MSCTQMNIKYRIKTFLKKQKFDKLWYWLRGRRLVNRKLRYFTFFVGNHRSGTTLTRSILDAHSEVMISNELIIVKYVKQGERWETILGRIERNVKKFKQKPIWTGYNYKVDIHFKKNKTIKVIGDKKAYLTTMLLIQDPPLLSKLIKWSPLPIKVIHCVRNPYDVISTKSRRINQSIDSIITTYFKAEFAASQVGKIVGKDNYFQFYHEDLIYNPHQTINQLLQFFHLEAPEQYYQACSKLIYDRPNKSRYKSEWSEQEKKNVQEQANSLPHLKKYFKDGKLIF